MSESQVPQQRNEQIRIQQLKDQIEQELRNNRALVNDMDKKLDKLRHDIGYKQSRIASLIEENQVVAQEKFILDQESNDLRMNIDNVVGSYQHRIKEAMNDYANKNKHLLGMESDYQREMQSLRQENSAQIAQVHQHWQPRLQSIEENYNNLLRQNDDLNVRVLKMKESFIRMRIEHDEQIRNMESRYYQEMKEKYSHQIDLFTKREAQAQVDFKKIEGKENEVNADLERLDNNIIQERNYLENEIQLERERIHQTHKEMSQFNIELETLKNRNVVLDGHVQMLVRKVEEVNRVLLQTKDIGLEDTHEKRFQHEQEYQIQRHTQAILHQRVIELEQLLRNSEAQNQKIKGDYEKLSTILQNRVVQTIAETTRLQPLR